MPGIRTEGETERAEQRKTKRNVEKLRKHLWANRFLYLLRPYLRSLRILHQTLSDFAAPSSSPFRLGELFVNILFWIYFNLFLMNWNQSANHGYWFSIFSNSNRFFVSIDECFSVEMSTNSARFPLACAFFASPLEELSNRSLHHQRGCLKFY